MFWKEEKKASGKTKKKNAWLKPWLKTRANPSAYDNLFAKFWLREWEEDDSFL